MRSRDRTYDQLMSQEQRVHKKKQNEMRFVACGRCWILFVQQHMLREDALELESTNLDLFIP